MDDKFTATYQVDDGYIGNRPKKVSIPADYIYDEATDAELGEMFDQIIDEHFRETVMWSSSDKTAFVAWAQSVIGARKGANDAE